MVSGVYYPVSRAAAVDAVALGRLARDLHARGRAQGRSSTAPASAALWGDIWPLILIGVIAIPAGLAVFAQGERYAKRHGRLKRSG